MRKFYTAEAVTEGHPDKLCDQIAGTLLRRESFGFLSFSCLPRNSRAVCRPVRRGGARGGEGPASDEIHCRPAGGVSARVKNSGFLPGLRESFGFLSFLLASEWPCCVRGMLSLPFFVCILYTFGAECLEIRRSNRYNRNTSKAISRAGQRGFPSGGCRYASTETEIGK